MEILEGDLFPVGVVRRVSEKEGDGGERVEGDGRENRGNRGYVRGS